MTEDNKKLFRDLVFVEREIAERQKVIHPANYGLPDLLFPRNFQQGKPLFSFPTKEVSTIDPAHIVDGWVREPLGYEETDEQYKERQDKALWEFIESSFYLNKGGKKIYVRLIQPMMEFIGGIFFRRTSYAIVWKPRGGGGSLSAAILIFLLLVYQNRKIQDIAGSESQAKAVYNYVCEFWDCFPGMSSHLLDGPPTVSLTRLRTGADLLCVPATEKQVRGKHPSTLVIDEACLLPGTKVITGRGLLPVEQVQAGDFVINQFGHLTKVKRVWSKQYSGEVVRIQPQGWKEGWWLTADHRVLRHQSKIVRNRKVITGNKEWVCAGDLEKTDFTFVPAIRERSRIPLFLESYDFWRFVGTWLGDGWISKGMVFLVFSCDEHARAQEIKQLIESLFLVTAKIYNGPGKNTLQICFKYRELQDWLNSFFGHGAINKGIPFDLLCSLTEEQLKALFIGLYETDGNFFQGCAVSGGVLERLTLNTSSTKLAVACILGLLRLNVVSSFRERPEKRFTIHGKQYLSKPRWVIDINGISQIVQVFGEKASGKRQRRPQSCWKNVTEGFALPIKKIEKREYSGIVWDIEVEEGESFLLPQGIVHNCQGGNTDEIFRAAMQGVISEYDPILILLSTFHLPSGLFQEYWDTAEEKGFTRINWSCLDCMAPCTQGLDCATEDDPKALSFCQKCILTYPEEVLDASGKTKITRLAGCVGKARDSKGWASFESIEKAYKQNIGSSAFFVEFLCNRPNYESNIYDAQMMEALASAPLVFSKDCDISVGIDWGIATDNSMVVLLAVRMLDCIYIHECLFMDHKLVKDVGDILNQWMLTLGKRFPIYADGSHPFNNAELKNAGFDIKPVNFGTWKKVGIQNVSKYIIFQRLKINNGLTMLLNQLKKYRRDTKGSIVKKEDHGPDALMVALMNWKFEDEFGDDIEQSVLVAQRSQKPEIVSPNLATFNQSGVHVVTKMRVPGMPVQQVAIPEKRKSGVLIF